VSKLLEKKTTLTMKKKKGKSLEELIPDAELRNRVSEQLYSGRPLLAPGSVFSEMLQAMVNASLDGEMHHFMEEEKAKESENRRNGYTEKVVRSTAGELQIKTPRDRKGDYDPLLIGKRQRELSSGMDEIILGLYARGNSIDDIQYQLRQLYGLELSTGLISTITERVWEEVLSWQQRPLLPCYAVIYLDGIYYRAKHENKFIDRTIHTVYGVSADGQRDVLGMYLFDNEGARNWAMVLEDLKKRGVETVLFFCVDGLSGFPQAIDSVYPQAIVQRCIVHMIRTSTQLVAEKDLKKVCADLRKIYTAANEDQAKLALEEFGRKWDDRYKRIRPKWEENWVELMAFMDFGQHIRRMIYTTNPVEGLHRIMRKVTKSKGAWTSDRALIKQLYLALKHSEKSWKKQAYQWKAIQEELVEKFGDAFSKYLEK
jgi:putative transposase